MARSLLPFVAILPAAFWVSQGAGARAADDSTPGRIIEERPTLKCLGVRWYVAGDDNDNARVEVYYRKTGAEPWTRGLDLFKTGPNWQGGKGPSAGEKLYAGSVFDLDEDTQYELLLKLVDPDGGAAQKVLAMKTRGEPRFDRPLRTLHVAPDRSPPEPLPAPSPQGTAADPLCGLEAAQAAARPGDLILVHQGSYPATWEVTKSGEEARPIVWRAAGDGEAVIGHRGEAGHRPQGWSGDQPRPGCGISASGIHDVWFEGLSIAGTQFGLVGHNSARIVVRRCNFYDNRYGVTATKHSDALPQVDWYVADNRIVGPSAWPRSRGIEDARGIQINGLGNVVCYNFIRGFADAVDTFQGPESSAIDIYNNDCAALTDDGIECDFGQFNVRCFRNRLTNVFQGISTQPTYGGPIYIFRNAILNVGMETFKMHNDPSGVLVFHNTSVKTGMPLLLYGKSVTHCVYRNNIFIGSGGGFAYENTSKMVDCSFDYDGFGFDRVKTFMKWNNRRFATAEDLFASKAEDAPYAHVVLLDPQTTFHQGDVRPKDVAMEIQPGQTDLRLAPRSAAVDRGEVLFGINDGFRGKAPDLGAYELGDELPHYGPRPQP